MGKILIIKGADFSDVSVGTVTPITGAPVILISSNGSVTITCENATGIYYTTDGSVPTSSSNKYTSPFSVSAGKTIKSIAVFSDGSSSSVSSKTYELEPISYETIIDQLYKTDKTKYGGTTFSYAKADVTGLSNVIVSSEMVGVTEGNTGFWVVVFKSDEDTVLGGKTIVDVAGTGTREFSNVEVSIPTGTKYLLVNGTNASIKRSA